MMKFSFILLIALIVTLTSCSSYNKINYFPQEENFYVIDFSDYSQQGFYISPEKPVGSYIPIGMIDYRFAARANKEEIITASGFNLDGTAHTYTKEVWVQDDWNMDRCMDTVVNVCKTLGADALFNFEILPNNKMINDGMNTVTFDGIRITGFAIKRE